MLKSVAEGNATLAYVVTNEYPFRPITMSTTPQSSTVTTSKFSARLGWLAAAALLLAFIGI